jgi:hypothetical protein
LTRPTLSLPSPFFFFFFFFFMGLCPSLVFF